MSSDFFSICFISSEHCSTFLISSKLLLTHLSSSVRHKAITVRGELFYTMFRAPTSPCNIPTPLHCVYQQHVHIHAATTMRFATTCCRIMEEPITRQNERPAIALHTRTVHCRLQAAATVPPKNNVSRSGILPNTRPMQYSCNNCSVFCNQIQYSKAPCNCNVQEYAKHIEAATTVRTTPTLGRTLPQVTTSLTHHFPKSHHFSKSPLP